MERYPARRKMNPKPASAYGAMTKITRLIGSKMQTIRTDD
jgi:hypothetical protein